MGEQEEQTLQQEFIPRPYQIYLYERAVEENSIIYLPTGSGKTFIAVLLVKRFSADLMKPYKEDGKRTIFIVNTVTLVHQQSAFLSRHTGLNCQKYCGEMHVDFWTKNEWEKEIEKNQILVMTAQIFLDILNHGVMSLQKVNLLIFDECHRGVGDHPMRLIMKRYYEYSEHEQPHVLAMSATLLNSNVKFEKISQTIKELEATYHAKIVTVDSLATVMNYSTNPREFIEFHAVPTPCPVIKQITEIAARTEFILNIIHLPNKFANPNSDPIFHGETKAVKLRRNIEDVLENLKEMGIYGGSKSVLLHMIKLEIIKKFSDDAKLISALDFVMTQLIKMQKLLSDQMEGLSSIEALNRFSTDKVQKLIQVIKSFYKYHTEGQKFCCIVFAKRRFTAKVLCCILKQLSSCDPELSFLKPDYMVGCNADPFKNARELLLQSKQNSEVLTKFRNGQCNCIVATDVVDEGVDVPSCSLVIRYYVPQDFRAYIQSKGRARHNTSHYIILAAEDENFKKRYNAFHQTEGYLHQTLHGKTDFRYKPTQDEIDGVLNDNNMEPFLIQKKNGTTSAITEQSAISLINRYCANLVKSKFITLTPAWTKDEIKTSSGIKYRVNLTLPPICPLKKTISSDEMNSIDVSKRSAAMKAAIQLYKMGELDENLLPIKAEDALASQVTHLFPCWKDEEMNRDDGIPGTHAKKRQHALMYPEPFKNAYPQKNQKLYLHILEMKPLYSEPHDNRHLAFYKILVQDSTFAVLSSKKMPHLPSFPIFMNVGKLEVNVKTNNEIDPLSEKELDSLRRFHYLIFHNVLGVIKKFMIRGEHDEENSYLIVPVNDEHKINWEVINQYRFYKVNEPNRPIVVKNSEYDRALITPMYRASHIYIVTDVCEFLKAESTFPTASYRSYVHYFQERHSLKIEVPEQSMLEVKPISKKINCIKPRTIKANISKRKRANLTEDFEEHLVPELCAKIEFPSLYYLKATTLPSILHRVSQLLIAEELRVRISREARLKLEKAPSKWEALTITEEDVSLSYFDPGNDTASEDGLLDDEDSMDLNSLTTLNPIVEVDVLSQERSLYSWTKDEEPPDLERNADQIQLIDIERYYKFIAGVTSEDESNLKHINDIKSKYESVLQIPVPPLKLLAATNPIGPSPVDILKSLTAKAANDVFNFERAETLGDSFLKFSVCLYLYQNYPSSSEGALTYLKGKLVGNRNLFYCGKEKNIPGLMNIDEFNPMCNYIVPTYVVKDTFKELIVTEEISANILHDFEIPEEETYTGHLSNGTLDKLQRTFESWIDKKALQTGMEQFLGLQVVSDKSTSDCVEALLGTYLSTLGIEGALKVLNWFNILPDIEIEDYLNSPVPDPKLGTGDIAVHMPWADSVEKKLGYKFKDRAFLLQAFTHASYISNQVTSSYQRLEFLGDAILDFFLTVHIYETCGNLNPGELTDLRSALVNNITFACLAVRYGLNTALLEYAPKVFDAVDRFVRFQEDRKHAVDDELLWVLLEEEECNMAEHVDVPKVLGDIFESVIGAIFLDSGKNFETTWEIIYRLMHKEIATFSQNVPKQPIRVIYETQGAYPQFSNATPVKGSSAVMVSLTIKANGKKKYFHGFGSTKKLAKCAAAKQAIKYLKYKKN